MSRRTYRVLLQKLLIGCVCFILGCDGLDRGSTLHNILHALKFRVTKISALSPVQLDRLDVLFLRELSKALTDEEIEEIRDFVRDGGILVAAGDSEKFDSLLSAYRLRGRKLETVLSNSQRLLKSPLFPTRPVPEIRSRTDFLIELADEPVPDGEVIPLYGFVRDGSGLDSIVEFSIVGYFEGKGRAFFISCPYIFRRSGLKYEENATFLYNLMSTLPRKARIGLAEVRYYSSSSTSTTDPLMFLLFRTPGGWAAVYIGLTLFMFLILRGQRFGRPLEPQARPRRLSSEYVLAMTTLYQKADTRLELLEQIGSRFRFDLGVHWGVDVNLETSAFVEEIARGAASDADELKALLSVLDSRRKISEAQLLEIANRVDAYYERTKMRRTRRS